MIQAKLIREIDHYLDEVVKKAEDTLKDCLSSLSKNKTSQLRNLQNLANSTYSLAAFLNFLRYQVGRNQIPQKLQKSIEKDIEDMEKEIIHPLTRKFSLTEKESNQLLIELLRRYLGFLVRAYEYKRKEK